MQLAHAAPREIPYTSLRGMLRGTGYEYLSEILPPNTRIVWHGYTENDLLHKAEAVLGIPPNRVIKTLYLGVEEKRVNGAVPTPVPPQEQQLAGVVLPITLELEPNLMAAPLEISVRRAKAMKFVGDEYLPAAQKNGCSGPWITEEDARNKRIKKVMFHDISIDELADFALPGDSKVSVLTPYNRLFEGLSERFPGVYQRVNLVKSRAEPQ